MSFVRQTGDAIPEAKPLHSLGCFNVTESTCANKHPATLDTKGVPGSNHEPTVTNSK